METTAAAENKGEKKITNISLKRIIIGLGEIGNLDIEDFNTNYNITRTIANLSQVEKAYTKSASALQKEYIKKDEKGNLISENGFWVFDSEEKNKEFQQKATELDEKVVDESVTKVWRIKASELKKVKGLKATSMAKCHELIIDDIDDKVDADSPNEKK